MRRHVGEAARQVEPLSVRNFGWGEVGRGAVVRFRGADWSDGLVPISNSKDSACCVTEVLFDSTLRGFTSLSLGFGFRRLVVELRRVRQLVGWRVVPQF